MHHPITDSGVILKKLSYGEADEILTVLFKEEGLRKLFVAGARKSKKNYPGLSDHFLTLEFSVLPSSKGLWRVSQVVQKKAPEREYLSDLRIYGFLAYFAELVCEFVPEGINERPIFDLWQNLNEHFLTRGFSQGLVISTLMNLLMLTGYDEAWDVSVQGHSALNQTDQDYLRELLTDSNKEPATLEQGRRLVQKMVSITRLILQKEPKSAAFFLSVLGD